MIALINMALLSLNRCIPNSIRSLSTNKLINTQINKTTGITTIILNRQPVNCLNYELLSELSNILNNLTENKSKGVILTSSCPKVFAAGLDFNEIFKPDKQKFVKFWTELQNVWIKLYSSNFPTVAAINGHAPAGGCLLALCCEYRIILPKFTIGLNETKVGLIVPKFLQNSMKNTINTHQAELAITTGKLFTSEEALRIGLVDEIAQNSNDLMIKAENYLNQFSTISAEARNLTKLSFRSADITALENGRNEDLITFWNVLIQQNTQNEIEKFMLSLKKKLICK